METVADGYATSYRRADLKFGSSLDLEIVLYKQFVIIQTAIDTSLTGLGRITGEIIDLNNGNGIPGVTVTLEKTNIGAATRTDGSYIIHNIPPGEYTLVALSIGYGKIRIEKLSISSNEISEICFGMSPRIEYMGSLHDPYRSPRLEKYQTSNKTKMDAEDIETMPASTLDDILKKTPGFVK